MKIKMVVILGILFLVSQRSLEASLVLKNQKDKISYIIWMDIGNNLKNQSIEIDPEILLKGVKDALSGEKPLMSEQEIRETVTAFQKEAKVKQEEMAKKAGEKNKKEGDAFLAENKKKEGVKT